MSLASLPVPSVQTTMLQGNGMITLYHFYLILSIFLVVLHIFSYSTSHLSTFFYIEYPLWAFFLIYVVYFACFITYSFLIFVLYYQFLLIFFIILQIDSLNISDKLE